MNQQLKRLYFHTARVVAVERVQLQLWYQSVTEERTHQVHAFASIYTRFTNTLVPFLTHSKSYSGSGSAGALHKWRTDVGTEYKKVSLEKGQE